MWPPCNLNTPSSVWPIKRPRYYWLSWGIGATNEYDITEEEGFTRHTIRGVSRSLASYLPNHRKMPEGMQALPTFVRSVSRNTPWNAPAGIDSCNAEELTRWRNDSHRFPPYQYKDDNTIYDNRKRRRVVADTLLRETFMLFREDHTHAGVTRAERAKGPMVERDLRDSWIGNSMHC